MAQPHSAFVVNQFIQQFLSQWHCGFQPSISMQTDLNGAISISYNVSISPPSTTPQGVYQGSCSHQDTYCKRSGRGSRSRRRKHRASKQYPEAISYLAIFGPPPPSSKLPKTILYDVARRRFIDWAIGLSVDFYL